MKSTSASYGYRATRRRGLEWLTRVAEETYTHIVIRCPTSCLLCAYVLVLARASVSRFRLVVPISVLLGKLEIGLDATCDLCK
jgi:hypothetical protein